MIKTRKKTAPKSNPRSLRTIKTPIKIRDMEFILAIDSSTSVSPHKNKIVKMINDQISSIKAQHASRDTSRIRNTYVTLHTFDDSFHQGIRQEISEFDEIDPNSFIPQGMTALNDAVGLSITDPQLAKDAIKNLIVITDGGENASKSFNSFTVNQTINAAHQTDMWTISACVPFNGKAWASQVGIPEGNVTSWEISDETSVNTLSQSISKGVQSIYSGASRGITRSTNFFQPDLNVTKTEVKRELFNVTKNFNRYTVNLGDSQRIDDFCREKSGKPYVTGRAFYQLTKKEKVQVHKELVLMDNNTGELFSGPNIRSMLGVPGGGNIELHPNFNPKWTLFIRSTSVNRKLEQGSTVLYQK